MESSEMLSVEARYSPTHKQNLLERSAKEGDSPVYVNVKDVFCFQRVELFGIAAQRGW